MKWNNLIIMLVIIIIVLICIEGTRLNTLAKCPKQVTEYRYVPRTFKEEQDEPVIIEDIFNKMFSYPSPWMIENGLGTRDKRETGLKEKTFNTDFRTG